jgi:polyferredoxin
VACLQVNILRYFYGENMAKKSRQAKKAENEQSTVGKIRAGRRPIWYLVLVGVLAAAWIVWRFEPSQGLQKALIFGGIAFLVWLVFVYLSQRSGNQKDE